MSISITVEGRDRDEWQLASKLLKIIEEAQPSIKERLGIIGPSETKKEEDFHSRLASIITKKISKNIFKMDFTPELTFIPPKEAELETIPLKEFVLMILQFEEEAADEIFGDE